MNDKFDSVFETLFSELPINYRSIQYPYDFPPNLISNELREIRNYISKKISFSSKSVRSDAKYYLLSNYLNMVLLPLLIYSEKSSSSYPLKSELLNDMKKDIDLILAEVERIDSIEISSHTIMKAIDKLWGKLNSTSEALWTKTDRY
jgi:hypothetical protein